MDSDSLLMMPRPHCYTASQPAEPHLPIRGFSYFTTSLSTVIPGGNKLMEMANYIVDSVLKHT